MHENTPRHRLIYAARLGITAVVCLSLGMHWGVLQGFAWARMLVTFAAERSMLEAVEMTFDGEHPCELCLIAQEGRNQAPQQTPQSEQVLKKLFAVLHEAAVAIPAPAADMQPDTMVLPLVGLGANSPETPPPRRDEA